MDDFLIIENNKYIFRRIYLKIMVLNNLFEKNEINIKKVEYTNNMEGIKGGKGGKGGKVGKGIKKGKGSLNLFEIKKQRVLNDKYMINNIKEVNNRENIKNNKEIKVNNDIRCKCMKTVYDNERSFNNLDSNKIIDMTKDDLHLIDLKKDFVNRDIIKKINNRENLNTSKIIDITVNGDIIEEVNNRKNLDTLHKKKLNKGMQDMDAGCGICCNGFVDICGYIKYEVNIACGYIIEYCSNICSKEDKKD
jgi:hypothetical protein